MASSGIYYFKNISSFYREKKIVAILSTHSRYFCSKDNDAVFKDSNSSSNSSKEKLDQKAGKATLKLGNSLRFKPAPVTEEMKEAAKQKLKSLLSEITITSEETVNRTSNLNLAKAVKRILKKDRLKIMEAEKITAEKKMNMAVKAIASNLKEDSEKVESELKEKLATLKLTETDTESIKDTRDIPDIDSEINKNLISSVEEVASAISENPIPPRSELAKRLMRLSLEQKIPIKEKKSLKSSIEGITIETKKAVPKKIKEEHSEMRVSKIRKPPAPSRIEHVNLFGAAPMNIFIPGTEMIPNSTNTLWQKLQEKEVRLLTQFAPANAFEEMIMWTEQGKHWKFPIDNEAEIGAEEKVGFHEHIFLEKHLKGFPTKGPIRHFMELVCVGLSKNPYITVERKIENIEWFRNYFKEKEQLLRECGTID